MNMKLIKFFAAAAAVLFAASCVSIEDIAMNSAADLLSADSGGAAVFTRDNDPQLVAEALPLALKLYEMVLMSKPEHADLQYATGKNFIMYANAFIQTPAGMLPDDDYLEQEEMMLRAKKMYFRGRDYIMQGLELKYPGFLAAVTEKRLDDGMAMVDDPDDAGLMYWAASGWIGAFSCDPFDFEIASELYIPVAMLFRALELDEGFSEGAVHDILIQVYASMPPAHIAKAIEAAPETTGMFYSRYYNEAGTGEAADKKALFHFNRSVELAGGKNPGTYCTYASAVSVKKQDYRQYRELLETALEIDPAENPDNELVVTIYQDKARWLLEHAEDFFISIEEF